MQPIPVIQLDPANPPQTNATIVTGHAQVNGKFYVRLTRGFYQNLRRAISWPLIGLFFITVWLRWDEHPLVLFSFAERRIFLGPLQLSWYDLPLLAGLLITAAVLLFFTAVAYGRIWCGFACPQSIWSWIFIRIEDWTEGSASHRRKQEAKGLTANGVAFWLRRISKHLLWLLVALATAITFTGYFIPAHELVTRLAQLDFITAIWAWVLTMTALTYLNAGLVREKICQHACPYARFQSVMFDADTRSVSYDRVRGEPRSAHVKQAPSQAPSQTSPAVSTLTANGDCVDCTLCVQVCPAGIDIRNGLQLACIDCGACIDACDKVMNKIGRATGLIRFASEHELSGKHSPLLRAKLFSYFTVLAICTGVLIWGFSHSAGLIAEVARERGQLYVERPDNTVCNDVQIKAESFIAGEYSLSVALSAAQTELSSAFELVGADTINLQQQQGQWLSYRVCALSEQQSSADLTFTFSLADEVLTKPFKFISPNN